MPRSGRSKNVRTVYSQGPGHAGPCQKRNCSSMRPQGENGAFCLEGEGILGDEVP